MRGPALIAGFTLVAFLAWAPAGLAQDCNDSPICQYVDEPPTADGPPGGGSGGGGSGGGSEISPSVSGAIQSEGGSDAWILEQIATSPTYGAPKKQPEAKRSGSKSDLESGSEGVGSIGGGSSSDDSGAASAVSSAFTDEGGGGQLGGLIAGMVAIGVAGVGAAIWRVRRKRA